MIDGNIPNTRHGRQRLVEAAAWLAALELRRQHPEAAMICDAVEALVETLSGIVVDRDGVGAKVAAVTVRALRQYRCNPSLQDMLAAVVDADNSAGPHDADRAPARDIPAYILAA